MEGDPHARNGNGLKYMFDYVFINNSKITFKHHDAFDGPGERIAFESFIDDVMALWEKHPDIWSRGNRLGHVFRSQ
jgi:hypothetical protein